MNMITGQEFKFHERKILIKYVPVEIKTVLKKFNTVTHIHIQTKDVLALGQAAHDVKLRNQHFEKEGLRCSSIKLTYTFL